jgi:hypothetical protein
VALALLETEWADTGTRFRFDIGKNRYYRYVVGSGRRRRSDGLEVIAEPVFESPVVGPLPPEQRGRGSLTIDISKADRENRLVQLWSFRTPEGAGPAVSTIHDFGLVQSDDAVMRPIAFAKVRTMPATAARLNTVPMRYREVQYSNAMFLDALGKVLTGILPQVGNLLGGLIGGGGAPAPAGAGAAPAGVANAGPIAELIKTVSNPDTIKQVLELIKQIQGATSGTAPAGTAPAKTQSLARSLSSGPLPRCRDEYSHAQFEPMTIIAGLTQLAPMLEKVLSPETVKAVLDAPTKHVATIMNGVLDFAKLGVQDAQKFREHLERLNPGTEDPGFNQLIAHLTQGMSAAPAPLQYARVSSVRLGFVQNPAVHLLGRDRIVYRQGALAFPLTVETPQTIPQATLQLEIKDAKTLAVHHRARYRVEQVSSGALLTTPGVSENEALRLIPNRAYLVCVELVWKNKQGDKRGTSIQQEVTLVGACTFDRIDESSELMPLDDPDRFRDYWHRIWEGAFESGIKRIELDAKYYYVLAAQRHNHARIETRSNLTADDRNLGGKLKAGMELSPEGLNRLLQDLDPVATPLAEDELAALTAPEFVSRFQQAARYRGLMRGRDGDHASLWVYPEFKIQHLTLQQVAAADEHGQVLELQPHQVRFPIPALLHFVGVRSE